MIADSPDLFMLEELDGIRVHRRALGWAFHCRYCDLWSRPTNSPYHARRGARAHQSSKFHTSLSQRVARLTQGEEQ